MRLSKSFFRINPFIQYRNFGTSRISYEGVNFDRNFPNARPAKAWDGKDRDQFFKKYAHVHARELKKSDKSKKRYQSEGRKFDNEKPARFPKKEQKKTPVIPQVSFNEYIYGTSSVLAALSGDKRTGFGMLYTSKSPNSADLRIVQAANDRKIPIEYDTPRAKMDQLTNNGVHNGYTIRVRPLDLPQVQHLLFNSLQNREQVKKDEQLEKIKAEMKNEKVDDSEAEVESMEQPGYGLMEYKFEQQLIKEHSLVAPGIKDNAVGVYIDEVTDPHNMGAIIRSAHFLGADFAIISSLNCAKLSPVVSKVSSGALESFPVYMCESPLKFFEKSVAEGWNLVAAVPPTTNVTTASRVRPSELDVINTVGPSLLVVGSEGTGLRKSLLQRCTHVVSISNGLEHTESNLLDSLNVSVATALLLSRFFKD